MYRKEISPVPALTSMMKSPAVPLALFKPLPNNAAQLPSCRRRITGVPDVLPRKLPQSGTFEHRIVAEDQSPITSDAALDSRKRLGSVMSSAKTDPVAAVVLSAIGPLVLRPGPSPLTSQVCHFPA